MARLPNPDEIQRSPLAPSGGSFSYRAGTAEAAAADAARRVGSANEEVGRAVNRFGETVGNLMLREQQRLDELVLSEAENKLRDIETKHTVAATSVKLAGVLEKDYIEKLSTGFDADTAAVEATLKNRVQRDMFQKARDNYKTSLLRTATMHAARESERADDAAYAGMKTSIANYVAANPYNTDGVADKIADLEVATAVRLQKLGVDPVAMKDAWDTEMLSATGGAHAAVVDTLLVQRDIAGARQYLDSAKGHMPEDQYNGLLAKLKPMAAAKKGSEIADQIIAAREEGLAPAEIKKLREGLTPEEDDAVDTSLRAYEHEETRAKNQAAGVLGNRFMAEGATAATQDDILASPEFADLEVSYPEEAKQLRVFMRGTIDQAEGKQERDEYREMTRRWKSPETAQRFFNIKNDPNFVNRTQDEIAAMAPLLGPDYTAKLNSAWDAKKKGIAEFKIPKPLLDAAMPKDIVSGDKHKDDRAAWLGLVDSNLADWKAANQDKPPTREDVAAILRATNKEIETAWYRSNKKQYQLKDVEEREVYRREALTGEMAARTPARVNVKGTTKYAWTTADGRQLEYTAKDKRAWINSARAYRNSIGKRATEDALEAAWMKYLETDYAGAK